MPLLNTEQRRKLLPRTPEMFSRLIVAGIPVDELLKKSALIVGAGGLGVIVSEILARTGIGTLYIVDRDIVSEGNFNRLGFDRSDIGRPKAIALARKLSALRNSDKIPQKYHLRVEAFHADIVGWDKLEDLIRKVDIIFSCVDNEAARRELNYLAMKNKKPLVDGGTSIDGLSGTIITVIPCKTPCYECYHSKDTSVRINNIERVGMCDASLATTMTMVAAIQADQGIKIILNYGKIIPLIKVDVREEVIVRSITNVKARKDCRVHQRFCQ